MACLFVKVWIVVLVATDLSRRMCFSGLDIPLPNVVCDNLGPSTSQFLCYFFSEQVGDSKSLISPQGINFYAHCLQQYIQHPPKLLERDFDLRGAGAYIFWTSGTSPFSAGRQATYSEQVATCSFLGSWASVIRKGAYIMDNWSSWSLLLKSLQTYHYHILTIF